MLVSALCDQMHYHRYFSVSDLTFGCGRFIRRQVRGTPCRPNSFPAAASSALSPWPLLPDSPVPRTN